MEQHEFGIDGIASLPRGDAYPIDRDGGIRDGVQCASGRIVRLGKTSMNSGPSGSFTSARRHHRPRITLLDAVRPPRVQRDCVILLTLAGLKPVPRARELPV
jgi:hypothetical protein